MLRVDLRHIKPGMQLAMPIRHPRKPDQILLRVGYELGDRDVKRLEEMKIRNIWVAYPALSCIEALLDPQVLCSQSQMVTQLSDCFEIAQRSATAKLPLDTYVKTLGTLVNQLIANPKAAMFLSDLGATDQQMVNHGSNVAYLATLVGLRLEGYIVKQRKHVDAARAKEVTQLGIGAMLHDIGMTQLPEEIRQRYERDGDEADPDVQQHTALGFDLVRGQIQPTAAIAVLHHHQRFDGSGFVGQGHQVLDGNRIHVFARIVGLVDQYDQLRHPRNLPPRPSVAALHDLFGTSLREKFDPVALYALLAVAPPFPPGAILKLSDGRFATAIDHDPENPCCPTVQVIPDPGRLEPEDVEPGQAIDLAASGCDVFVTECEGQPVLDQCFEVPPMQEMAGVAAGWR